MNLLLSCASHQIDHKKPYTPSPHSGMFVKWINMSDLTLVVFKKAQISKETKPKQQQKADLPGEEL